MKLVATCVLVWSAFAPRAHADPEQLPPPAPLVLPAETQLDLAVHVGVATTSYEGDVYRADATGPAVDVELGFRYRRLSLLAYADLTTGTATDEQNIQMRYAGFGVRARVHLADAFVGVGLGGEYLHQTGTFVVNDETMMTVDTSTPLVDLHAGYTFPLDAGLGIQVLAILQLAPFPDDGFAIGRLEVGATF